MADTIIVKVDLQDAQALAGLQNIDQLTKALNGRTVNLNIAGSSAAKAGNLATNLSKANTELQKLGKQTVLQTGAGEPVRVINRYNEGVGKAVKNTYEWNKELDGYVHTLKETTTDTQKFAAAEEKRLLKQEELRGKMAKAEENRQFRQLQLQEKVQNISARKQKAEEDRQFKQLQLQEKIKNIENSDATWIKNRVGTSGWEFDEEISRRQRESERFAKSLRGDLQQRQNIAKEEEKLAKQQEKIAKQRKKTEKPESPRDKHPILGDSIFGVAMKMGAWQLMGAAVSGAIRSFTEAVGTMKQVDTELTNIQKVTNMSKKEIDALGDSAYSTASKYGVAADEYLQNIGVFAKAGYKEQSDELGELAIKTQLVGDVTAEMASKFILSTDAAYHMGGSVNELSVVLDKANAIENNYATSIEKIAEGMPLVASVASTAHMSVDQTIAALGTITAKTQESGTMAARAMRALILNILGDTKTEIADGVSWTEGEIKSLNDVLMKYSRTAMEAAEASGEVVNPMEAIAGLAQAFKEGALSEADLIEITTDLGGKLRTNQLLALIKNFDTYNDMLQTMATSAGSADKEVDTMLSSWEKKSQVLKNTWTEFLTNFVDTDMVKDGLDLLTNGLKNLDEFTSGPFRDFWDDLMNEGARKAARHAEELSDALEIDYGAGSRYEYLISNQETLNALEREELAILEAKKAFDEEAAAAAEKDRWKIWQEENANLPGGAKIERGEWWQGNRAVSLTKAQVNLSEMTEAIENANQEFANTKDAKAYQEAIQGVVGEYADYIANSKAAKEAGIEISSEQEAMIKSFDLLTHRLAVGGEALDTYKTALISMYMALGDSKAEAIKKAEADVETFKESLDGIPDEVTTEVEADTETANSKIDATRANLESLDGKTATTFVNVIGGNYSGAAAAAMGGLESVIGASAEGSSNFQGGRSFVNELGPEAIISNGTAYIAGGGRPTIANIPQGSIILNASDTARAMQGGSLKPFARAFAAGLVRPMEHYMNDGQRPAGTPSRRPVWNSGGGDYGGYDDGGGVSAPTSPDFEALEKALDDTLSNLDKQAELAENEGRFVDAMKIYGQAQDEIEKLLNQYRENGYAPDSNEILDLANKGYDYAGKEISDREKLQKDLITALQELKATGDKANDLAEKEQAVKDAKEQLANATRQRTVRIYNPVTDQWEWIADSKDIQAAQKRLQDAEKSLKDEQISQELEKLENSKWEEIGGIKPGSALADLINSGTDAQKQEIANALGILSGGVDYTNSSAGKTPFNQGNDSHDTIYNFPGGIMISESEANNMTLKQLADKLGGLAMTK